jgi:3-hydroxyisobutyrate dehydrogenase
MAGPDAREPIAFLGLGIMGSRMAANLCRAGFEVHAWNRTRAKAEALAAEHGAHVADTPADAARAAGIAITMVVDAPEVEAVVLAGDGVAAGAAPGTLVVDMSTIAPSASRTLAERLAERELRFLDAPVTGSRPKAEDATLTIMVGGEAADFERARPALEAMGKLVLHVGPHGHGSTIKLLNNTVAAINAAAVAQALLAAQAAGVDPGRLVEVMSAGSGASAMLALKASPMLEADYDPLFKLEHMLKDVRHCLAEARRLGAPMTLGDEAERLYAAAAGAGFGEADFAAVVEAARGL